MRPLPILLIVIACALAAGPAAAKRSGAVIVRQEALDFVAETAIPGEGEETLSLCLFTRTRSLFWVVNLWQSRSWALGSDRCAGESYYDISEPLFLRQQARGLIPVDLPARPAWTPQAMLEGFWGLGLLAGLGALGVVKLLRRKGSGRKRDEVLGSNDTMGKRAAMVMAAAARADGRPAPAEIAFIRETLNTLTAEPLSEEEIRKILRHTASLTEAEFAGLARGIDKEDRQDLYSAALMVSLTDGPLNKQEKSFLFDLGQAMGLDKDEITLIHSRTLSHQKTG